MKVKLVRWSGQSAVLDIGGEAQLHLDGKHALKIRITSFYRDALSLTSALVVAKAWPPSQGYCNTIYVTKSAFCATTIDLED